MKPKKYRAKRHNSDEYVTGYYVYLPKGNTHHWIVCGGFGNGGWFCPQRVYIDIDTLEEVS